MKQRVETTEKSSGYILLLEAKCTFLEQTNRDFPGGPVVKILPSNIGGAGLIPAHRAKTPPTCLQAKTSEQKTEATL